MRLLLLDRDGTLLQHHDPYVLDWRHARYAAGALDALVAAAQASFRIAICSNQSPVGRRLVRASFVDEVNQRISRDASARGVDLVGFFTCIHRPGDGCGCRKPAGGLFREASRRSRLPLSTAWVVGDAASDMEAGRRVGAARLIHVCGGRDRIPCRQGDVICIGRMANLRCILRHPAGADARSMRSVTDEKERGA